MTILPKKKQNKQSSSNDRDDDRDNDHTGERYAYGHLGSGNSPPSGQLSPSHRTWSSRSEDKRTLPDSDLPEHPTIAAPHSKRRNRTIRDREMKMQRNMSKASLISASGSHDRKISENEMNNASSSKALDRVAKEEQHCVNEQENQDASGYNSGDEYQPNHVESEIDWDEKEKLFAWMMQKKGFEIKQMGEDGACLFRAVGMCFFTFGLELHLIVWFPLQLINFTVTRTCTALFVVFAWTIWKRIGTTFRNM